MKVKKLIRNNQQDTSLPYFERGKVVAFFSNSRKESGDPSFYLMTSMYKDGDGQVQRLVNLKDGTMWDHDDLYGQLENDWRFVECDDVYLNVEVTAP